MSTRTDIEKARMEFAIKNSKNPPNAKKYESYVLKVPAFIHTNGLGNTIAYIASQSDDNWQKTGDNIFDWLDNEKSIFKGGLNDKFDSLKEEVKQLKEKTDKLEKEINNETNKEIKKLKINEKKETEKRLNQIKLNKSYALLEKLVEIEDDAKIKLCTLEVLALFNWLRRFAKINKK